MALTGPDAEFVAARALTASALRQPDRVAVRPGAPPRLPRGLRRRQPPGTSTPGTGHFTWSSRSSPCSATDEVRPRAIGRVEAWSPRRHAVGDVPARRRHPRLPAAADSAHARRDRLVRTTRAIPAERGGSSIPNRAAMARGLLSAVVTASIVSIVVCRQRRRGDRNRDGRLGPIPDRQRSCEQIVCEPHVPAASRLDRPDRFSPPRRQP